MGCITSTPPKLNQMKSQTELMLNRSVTFDNQLRIIIDDDKYKPIQNTIKRINVNYAELSHSHSSTDSNTYTHSDTANSTPISCTRDEISMSSSSISIMDNGGVTLMGFVQNETNDDTNNATEDSEHTSSESEASLIHTGCITLMGLCDSNEVFIHSNHDLENKIVLNANQCEPKTNVTPN
eukprot:284909_1